MKSEDTGILAQVTTALDGLQAQGTPIGVTIQVVTLTVHNATVSYEYNTTDHDWNVKVQ